MKKWIKIAGIAVVAVVAVAIVAAVVVAQGPNGTGRGRACDACGQVGDGLGRGGRLNQEGGQAEQGQLGNGACTCGDPANGQGMMRGGRLAWSAAGTQPGGVDEDGDGICDTCSNGTPTFAQQGTRGRMGRWQSQ